MTNGTKNRKIGENAAVCAVCGVGGRCEYLHWSEFFCPLNLVLLVDKITRCEDI